MSDSAEWRLRLHPEDEHWLELANDPPRFFEELNSNVDNQQVEMARADVVSHLREWFSDAEGWQHDPARSGPIGDGWFGTEWTYGGIHDKDGAFNGLHATGNHVTVRGFTLMGVEGDHTVVHRYVDWLGLFGQLRLSVNWRLPHQPDPRPDDPDEPDPMA